MTLQAWLAAAMGGALGACLRLLIVFVSGVTVTGLFPWATFIINIAGSFAIGLVWGLWESTQWFMEWGRYFVVVGLLGGFTTFSAFSYESLSLISTGRMATAAMYIGFSVIGCIAAAWLGLKLGQ
ncbi:MAG: CrcB family protein [Pseudomonadota bacterium]